MADVPSKKYFDNRAVETGFLANNLEKVYRITQLLKEISSFDTEGYLALRGGTAINFCYWNVPRLSIDIDLVYVKSFEKNRMKEDRASIRKSLDRTLGFLRYDVEPKTTYALDQYLLTYRNRAGNPDKIKVEVNYVSSRIPILKVAKRNMVSLFQTNQPEVSVLAAEELFGSKIKALVERGIARDLYDVYLVTQNIGSIDFKTLKRATIFYSCLELKSDFRYRIGMDLFGGIDDRTIRRELTPLLRRETFFPLEKAKRDVSSLISTIFTLEEKENEFVEAFYSLDYRPNLLFASNPLLKNHPAAKWRLKMLAR